MVVFLEHDWNPQADLQAMDRAHRIGQQRVLHVYRLFVPGSLEAHILAAQKEKLEVARAVINDDNSSLASMDTDKLIDGMVSSTHSPGAAGGAASGANISVAAPPMPSGHRGANAITAVDDDAALERQYSELDMRGFLSSLS